MKDSRKSVPRASQQAFPAGTDEALYPELYRKSEYIKGSNSHVPKPFQIGNVCSNSRIRCHCFSWYLVIGKIVKISGKKDLQLTLEMFYR